MRRLRHRQSNCSSSYVAATQTTADCLPVPSSRTKWHCGWSCILSPLAQPDTDDTSSRCYLYLWTTTFEYSFASRLGLNKSSDSHRRLCSHMCARAVAAGTISIWAKSQRRRTRRMERQTLISASLQARLLACNARTVASISRSQGRCGRASCTIRTLWIVCCSMSRRMRHGTALRPASMACSA